jgi:hypothetical protein
MFSDISRCKMVLMAGEWQVIAVTGQRPRMQRDISTAEQDPSGDDLL